MTVRTRFAPSPTGYLHIGGVRTALFNWLVARRAGGQFILRIDDTDVQRNVAGALEPILAGFRWLGLDWDEGPEVGGPHAPYYQSERSDRYRVAVQRLLASGAAYRDFSTPEEFQAERQAAESAKQPFVYSRRWMADTDDAVRRFTEEGRTAVVRLKMPRDGKCEFHDLIRGPMSFDWSNEPDHVIQRADGSCLYNLATVVDDIDFSISHVIRSIEHLSNTPRQIFIFQALGGPVPQFAHLPYVAEPGSQNKLSKRKIANYLKHPDFRRLYDEGIEIAQRIGLTVAAETFNPVLVEFYQSVGYLPEAMLNYLLLLGWSLDDSTEDFSVAEMIAQFSLERVVKSPASFDPQKLTAFQARRFAALPLEKKLAAVLPFLQRAGLVGEHDPRRELVQRVVQAADQRLVIAGNILNFADFFVADDRLEYDERAFDKRLREAPEAHALLREYLAELESITTFSAPELEAHLQQFVQQRNIKTNQIIHGLRVALTGKSVGFGMFETMEILGEARCRHRIELALARLESIPRT